MLAPIVFGVVILTALLFLVDPINVYFAPIWEVGP